MNAFSALHLALAVFCLVMAGLHGALWSALRDEPAHKWVTLSFVGFAFLAAGIAGSSVATEGALGDPAPWLALTVPTALLLPMALIRTAWAVLDRPMTRARRLLLAAAGLLTLPVTIYLIYALVTDAPDARTYESVRYAQPAVAIPYNIAITVVALVWIIEAIRAIGSLRTLAWAALLSTLPASVLALREVAVIAAVLRGPTLVGLIGLPLGVFASTSLVVRYIRAMQQAKTPATDEGYRRMARLGTGGMGELWLALRSGAGGFQRWVVLKKIRFENPDDAVVERFMAEARVAARLHHANIVSVYDLGRYHDGWYIIMEYLAGPNVHEILQRCYEEQIDPPPGLVARIGEHICRGLECAHGHGILHRDVSPDNVIVTFDGIAKLLDFGIAKEADIREGAAASFPAAGSYATTGGGLAGKLQYLAPERIAGDVATAESDLFSTALVLVQLLGAPLPERGADIAGHPDPVSAHRPCPPQLEVILSKALAAHPKQRYRSAAAMADELSATAAELEAGDLGGWVRRLCRRRWAIQQELANLRDPTPEDVVTLFAEVEIPAPGVGSTQDDQPDVSGPPDRPAPTEVDES